MLNVKMRSHWVFCIFSDTLPCLAKSERMPAPHPALSRRERVSPRASDSCGEVSRLAALIGLARKAARRFNGGGRIMSSESSASSIFPRTDWAELGKAAEADEARLDRLIRLYWAPLRIFLVASFPSPQGSGGGALAGVRRGQDPQKRLAATGRPQPGPVPRFSQNEPAQFRAGPPEPGGVQTPARFPGRAGRGIAARRRRPRRHST